MRKLEVLALLLLAVPAPADDRARKYYYEDIAQPFFVLDAEAGVWRSARPGSRPGQFAAVKPKDGFRVFVIGGSIAGLLQFTGEKGELAQALAAALPSRTVEVVNCGMAGYESFREALVEQEILEHSPDLIVLLTGHNEGIASAPIPIWIMRTQERLSRLAAYRALARSLRPDGAVRRTDELSDARDKTFARNLTQSLRHARERGVPVAVVVPPRNYREPVELGRGPYDAEFVGGWLRFLRGDWEGARRAFKEAPVQDGAGRAFALGFAARAEEKLGLLAEARASFDAASRLDRAAICGALCQDILRAAARSEGAFLVEADAMFRALAFPRMPGMETFNDRMHWKPRFNCLMSSEVISATRAQPALGALPWDDAAVRALKASCEKPGGGGDADDDLRTLSYVLMGLSWPDFNRLSTVSVFYLESIRRRRPEWFEDVAALMRKTVNPQTQVYGLAMAPDAVVLPRFYWHIGEVRMLEKDYAGARADFAKALELDPKLSWTRVSLASAEALRGDGKRGLALLREAVARSTGDPRRDELLAAAVAAGRELGLEGAAGVEAEDAAYWVRKAGAAVDAKDKPAALAALSRARELSPLPYQLRLIGQYYFLLRETAPFLELFDALAKAYPKDVDLRLSRAEALFDAGRLDECRRAVALAEGLGPDEGQRRQIAGWRARLAKAAAR